VDGEPGYDAWFSIVGLALITALNFLELNVASWLWHVGACREPVLLRAGSAIPELIAKR